MTLPNPNPNPNPNRDRNQAWKKLFLVGFAVLVRPGSIYQLVAAFLFALTYMLLIAVAQPFREQSDDFFAKACGFGLSSLFFFCVILKVGVLAEAVNDVLTTRLQDLFGFDPLFISAGMIASIVGALVLAALMAAQQVAVAALVPVIKLSATKSVPDLPLRPKHLWHMFLSHIWGSGQDQCATIKRQLKLLLHDVKVFLDVRRSQPPKGRAWPDA